MSSSWGCPNEVNDTCKKVNNLPCNPGMKGCALAGRFIFFDEDKNKRLREKQERTSKEEAGGTGVPAIE
jgi:orotidine-5'-phosphate decarboxylase